jgi:hypothetical protein
MTVSVYTLRIREDADDTDGTEVRIVAASLTEAVARAEMRFGAGRILSIEQAEAPPTAAELAADAADAGEPTPDLAAAPIVADDFIVAQAPESLPDAGVDAEREATAALAYVHPATGDRPTPPPHDPVAGLAFETTAADEPAPLTGPWRPSVLVWGGAIAGLVVFALWANFGGAPRERFITASADAAPAQPGLPIEGEAPPGGVINAAGVSLRPGRADAGLGDTIGQAAAGVRGEDGPAQEIIYDGNGADDIDDDTVRSIGTVVGDLLARWPEDEPQARAPMPPPAEVSMQERSWPPQETVVLRAPREPALLQRWYVEVQRADRVTETLAVNATSPEQALAIIYNRPDHPVVVNGPSTELTW